MKERGALIRVCIAVATIGLLTAGCLLPMGCTTIAPAVDVAIGICTNQSEVVTVPGVPPPFPPVPQDPAPVATGEAQTLWDAYDAREFAKHGYQGEDAFRESCIAGAKSAGKTAMAIRFYPNEPPARIEIYEWESDKTKGKFRPNWTRKARDGAGVKRWVVDIRGCDLAVVRDTFKAYGPDTDFHVQFMGVPITADVMKDLECDGQGIKTTPRLMR